MIVVVDLEEASAVSAAEAGASVVAVVAKVGANDDEAAPLDPAAADARPDVTAKVVVAIVFESVSPSEVGEGVGKGSVEEDEVAESEGALDLSTASAAAGGDEGTKTSVTFWADEAARAATVPVADGDEELDVVDDATDELIAEEPSRASFAAASVGEEAGDSVEDIEGASVAEAVEEGKADDDDDNPESSAACAWASESVLPSSSPENHIGRMTPVSGLNEKVWLL